MHNFILQNEDIVGDTIVNCLWEGGDEAASWIAAVLPVMFLGIKFQNSMTIVMKIGI